MNIILLLSECVIMFNAYKNGKYYGIHRKVGIRCS